MDNIGNNLAVVLWSGSSNDDGAILYMSGKDIEQLFGPGGTYDDGEGYGCNAVPLASCPGMLRGISIWEGDINDSGGSQHETGFVATGVYRRPTLNELNAIVEGNSPFDK